MNERERPTCQGTGWAECDVETDEDGNRTADVDVCWRCNGEGRVKE